MRIGILVTEFAPPWTEGVRNAAFGMAKELINIKNKVFVITSWHDGLKEFEMINKLKIYRIPNLIRQIPIFKTIQINPLLRLIKLLDLDVIVSYIRSFYLGIGIGLSVISYLTQTPLIHIVHSYPELFLRKNLRWILPLFFNRNTVVSSTKHLRYKLAELGISSHFIPIGIDTERFSSNVNGSKIRQELSILKDSPVVFFSGGPHTQGINAFLKALEKVCSKHPEITIIFNKRSSRMYLEDWGQVSYFKESSKELDIAKNIRYIGTRDDILSIYAASDIIVLPTFSSLRVLAYPLSLLEGMSMGKAVITTEVGSIPEIVENKKTGILINSRDPDKLANAIITLVEDRSLRQKLGENARMTTQTKFNIKTVSNELFKLIERIV